MDLQQRVVEKIAELQAEGVSKTSLLDLIDVVDVEKEVLNGQSAFKAMVDLIFDAENGGLLIDGMPAIKILALTKYMSNDCATYIADNVQLADKVSEACDIMERGVVEMKSMQDTIDKLKKKVKKLKAERDTFYPPEQRLQ